MDELLTSISKLEEEIKLLREDQEAKEEYQALMNEEISEKQMKIQEIEEKINENQEIIHSFRNEYSRSEAQIVALQYSIETAKGVLKAHVSRKNELEILNDKWETSIRSLEYYNNQLEEQLQDSEDYVLSLHCKIQNSSMQTKDDLSILEAKNEEIKKIIRNKSRSPSPIPLPRPPVSPKGQITFAKPEIITIVTKPLIDDTAKVIIVTSESQYLNERVVQVKDKTLKKTFEFSKVIKRSTFADEIREILKNLNYGKNCCIVLSSQKNRENSLNVVAQVLSEVLINRMIEINIVEIIKDQESNLLNEIWKKEEGQTLEKTLTNAIQKLKKVKNHFIISIKVDFLFIQVIDLGEVTEDQDLSESLSLNASLFYFEELMMNLNKEKIRFDKSTLTKKFQLSINSNYFLAFLMHFDGINDLPGLCLAARLEAVFSRNYCNNEENHRTLDLLEKERLANFKVLRSTASFDRRFSESPKFSPLYQRPSKIPLPKPKRLEKKINK
jgi:hypothetical protein